MATPLQRSHSVSTDDLSIDTNEETPGEWRRVSKLRRSFQSNSTSSAASDTVNTNSTKATWCRPPDLPSNSVSVSRLRAELEQGRRLNTAMRNNHVDLAALDTILNKTTTEKPTPTKRTTFLTAKSLQEIRNKLKRLSDESLYKEDFLTTNQEKPQVHERDMSHLSHQPTEQTSEKSAAKSAFKVVARQVDSNATKSLETRQKYRDSSSTEWHLRRKSYGFEKMMPNEEQRSLRMDASTDSGLGRSGEISNLSPTSEITPTARSTVVHFGSESPTPKLSNSNIVTAVRYRRPLKSPVQTSTKMSIEDDINKRHSIAVDESKYVRENLRKTSQVHLSGFYADNNNTEATKSLQIEGIKVAQGKRVEFSKTEVHFAAESGRVNIVETDGKPPPTNNFRRRHRTTSSSGPLQSLVKSAATASIAMPTTHFGDDSHLRRKTIATTVVAYKASLSDAPINSEPDNAKEPLNITVSIANQIENTHNSYTSTTSGIDNTDNEIDEMSAIRGILKNKPIKPKPYHLGDNIGSADALWGVQLKPVLSNDTTNNQRDTLPLAPMSTDSPANLTSSTVAERVRIVEKRQEPMQSIGYSTKIKLNIGDASKDWAETGVQRRRPSAQDLILQDLREHQRILDEGLKSTSLIIKTMRSATQFDEAMRRLSIASSVPPPLVEPTTMLRSNSYQDPEAMESLNDFGYLTKSASYSSSSSISSAQSIAVPRLQLGNAAIPISQQLAQLRRMYDLAASQEEDSADEEVRSYFRGHNDSHSDSGGGTQGSSSLENENCIEHSSSWSRMKAKRTIWKLETNDERNKAKTLERKGTIYFRFKKQVNTI